MTRCAGFGGEEFLLVFVGCDVSEAAPVVHRLRSALAESVAASGVPPFTVSVGLADTSYGGTAAEIIAYADDALLTAKREGRDQLIIAAKPDSRERGRSRRPGTMRPSPGPSRLPVRSTSKPERYRPRRGRGPGGVIVSPPV